MTLWRSWNRNTVFANELTEFWDQTQPVEFEVNIQSEVMYYRLDVALSKKIT